MRLVFVVALFAALTVAPVLANWPQWRGPSLNGVSTETGLPVTWSATEGIAWKLPMPSRSGSTPIIWGDLIFLNVAMEQSTGALELWAIDRNTKGPIWKRPIAGGNNQQRKQNMSSPSPATDGTHLWVMRGVASRAIVSSLAAHCMNQSSRIQCLAGGELRGTTTGGLKPRLDWSVWRLKKCERKWASRT